jgi:hypothetical protein
MKYFKIILISFAAWLLIPKNVFACRCPENSYAIFPKSDSINENTTFILRGRLFKKGYAQNLNFILYSENDSINLNPKEFITLDNSGFTLLSIPKSDQNKIKQETNWKIKVQFKYLTPDSFNVKFNDISPNSTYENADKWVKNPRHKRTLFKMAEKFLTTFNNNESQWNSGMRIEHKTKENWEISKAPEIRNKGNDSCGSILVIIYPEIESEFSGYYEIISEDNKKYYSTNTKGVISLYSNQCGQNYSFKKGENKLSITPISYHGARGESKSISFNF